MQQFNVPKVLPNSHNATALDQGNVSGNKVNTSMLQSSGAPQDGQPPQSPFGPQTPAT